MQTRVQTHTHTHARTRTHTGYFAMAKALLDVKTDENGTALALDIVKVLESSDLEIDHEVDLHIYVDRRSM